MFHNQPKGFVVVVTVRTRKSLDKIKKVKEYTVSIHSFPKKINKNVNFSVSCDIVIINSYKSKHCSYQPALIQEAGVWAFFFDNVREKGIRWRNFHYVQPWSCKAIYQTL